ncbi:MAG: hypothetical protein OJJ21_22600 [Ferrovibrio sp.]|uniref:hypothetical protein n=1 Tax=Ferrovibrio sp. TaxID=1917215 RepID=UPI002608F5F6|nr:hypothetical protein [Ferrovibrio sp.]MCW0236406.1 hypothetical protein [Ferrovibrio sp.]
MQSDRTGRLTILAVRADALRRAMEAVMNGSTPDHAKWGAFKSYARTYNKMAEEYSSLSQTSGTVFNVEAMKGSMGTVWPVQKEIFDMVYAEVLMLSGVLSGATTGITASISEIQDLLVANLRQVIFRRPEKEFEVQNAIESLLIGRGYQKPISYDREAGKFKFSGREYIPDFVFHNLKLALEIKLIRERQHVSACIEEMSADIAVAATKTR